MKALTKQLQGQAETDSFWSRAGEAQRKDTILVRWGSEVGEEAFSATFGSKDFPAPEPYSIQRANIIGLEHQQRLCNPLPCVPTRGVATHTHLLHTHSPNPSLPASNLAFQVCLSWFQPRLSALLCDLEHCIYFL